MVQRLDDVCDFYGTLAPWWPLISPVEDYEEEADYAAVLLRTATRAVRDVLELGSGGGHNASYLREQFNLTLTDLSESMLAVSRALNPRCRHVQGDMRMLRLGETFDAVFVHDAIDYMTTEADLAAAFATARAHLRPGGVAVIFPDHTAENFEPASDHGGSDSFDGRGVRFLEWTWDPNPGDTWVQTEYSFVLRAANGRVTTAHESHRTGLFPEATWLRLLTDSGFEPQSVIEETSEDRIARTVFVAHLAEG